ncbi:hypothetical protein SAMN05443572_105184 [Myxococcus fulvus]|uniref:Uncharacterized protein n=1 Tax=Myxococcus fulvus TaxID=33 RepID=A0A511TB95_MYXFU|nr:hypothetical protein [Myxococcus fulvus]GEN11454.1 hypothetical protein MFU01_64910 [Myxococcus fulvus]SEU13340.1 hypothetical protein SAMN05443572_105184 [Myxococcus fulvus]
MDPSNIDPTLDFDWKAELLEEHAAKATSEEQLTERTWRFANHLIETHGHYPSWAYEEAEYRIARLRMLLRHLESRRQTPH